MCEECLLDNEENQNEEENENQGEKGQIFYYEKIGKSYKFT